MILDLTCSNPGNVGFHNLFSVVDYGADPTGNADSTTAIGLALAAVVAAAPATLYFPPGLYRYTSYINVSVPYISVVGAGPNLSILRNDTYGDSCIRLYASGCMVSGLGFYGSQTTTVTGTFAAGVNTFTPAGGLGSITTNSVIYLDQGLLGEPIIVTSTGTGTFTATTLLPHSGTISVALKSSITGTVDGVAARNVSAGVYAANAGNLTIDNCAFYGTVVGVSLRGGTAGNTYNNSGSRVSRLYGKGLDQLTLVQQQNDAVFDNYINEYITESQTKTPPHTIYLTGTNPGPNAQRNNNIVVSNMTTYVNNYGNAYQMKFTSGLVATNLTTNACERGWDVEGCNNFALSNCNSYNVPQNLTEDTNQCIGIVQDSWDGVITNCNCNMLSEDNATVTTDSTDSFGPGTNTWSISGVTAGQAMVFDTGVETEITYALTSTGSAITATTVNPHVNVNTTSSGNYAAGTVTITVPSGQIGVYIFANCYLTLDSGTSVQESVTVASVSGNTFTCTTVNAHNGSVTPFTITAGPFQVKVYPFTDNQSGLGIGGIFVRAADSQNANGQGCHNIQINNCKVVSAYSQSYTGAVHRIEGSDVTITDCVLEQIGLYLSAGWYWCHITKSAGSPSSPNATTIINPRILGCQFLVKNDLNCTNTVITIDTSLIQQGFNDTSISNSVTGTNTIVTLTGSFYANIGSNSYPTLAVNSSTSSIAGLRFVKTKNSSGIINVTGFTGMYAGQIITITCWDTTAASPGQKTTILPGQNNSGNFQMAKAWLPFLGDTITFLYDRGNASGPYSPEFKEISRSGGNGILAISAGATSIDASQNDQFVTANTTTTTISSITNGLAGMRLTIYGGDTHTTLAGSGIELTSAFTTTTTNSITLGYNGTNWIELGRGGV